MEWSERRRKEYQALVRAHPEWTDAERTAAHDAHSAEGRAELEAWRRHQSQGHDIMVEASNQEGSNPDGRIDDP